MVECSSYKWEPPSTFEEKVKATLIPARWRLVFLAHWMLRKGERELGFLSRVMGREKVGVDVGANRGVYTYWMQKYSRHVYAYEPNPKMFVLLRAGAKGNVTA